MLVRPVRDVDHPATRNSRRRAGRCWMRRRCDRGTPRLAYALAEHRPSAVATGGWCGGRERRPSPRRRLFAAYDEVVVNGYGTEGGFVVELFDGEANLTTSCRGSATSRW